SNRNLDESFVMLAGSASSLRQAPAHASANGIPLQPLDSKFAQMAKVFEIAVQDEVEVSIKEAQQECAAYEAAIKRLAEEDLQPLTDQNLTFLTDKSDQIQEYAEEMKQAQEAEAAEKARADKLEAELAHAERELSELGASSSELDSLEERYWHDFNDFQLQLRAHVDERDVLLNKATYKVLVQMENSAAHLKRLQQTNVYHDVFRIWHEGPFGTIGGFRLGRTNEAPVEWDEINAAWGQTVLLLKTMAQECGCTFSSYRLIPMGSYPQIADKRGTHDLYGPVSRIMCASYDRAMVMFLTCVKEFADWIVSQDNSFEMAYAIDQDKVANMTVRLQFNSDSKWTKALKYMLTNLKYCLKWAITHQKLERNASAARTSHNQTNSSSIRQ
ncbi:MAG: beclin 1, partial [Trebouxia sp. A1-2]